MREKLKVGDVVWMVISGNLARHEDPDSIKPTPEMVTSVGRKYFTVGTGYAAKQFNNADWLQNTDTCVNYILYPTESAYYHEKEARQICKELGRLFEHGQNKNNIHLEDLREIKRLCGIA